VVIGLITFGALIYGGFRYLTSAGNPTAMSDAKDQISSALLGLILLFCSWLILNTINPELILLGEPPIYEKKCTNDITCTEQACVNGKCSQTFKPCSDPSTCDKLPQFYCEPKSGFCAQKPVLIILYKLRHAAITWQLLIGIQQQKQQMVKYLQ
jgi:hypothetical protein